MLKENFLKQTIWVKKGVLKGWHNYRSSKNSTSCKKWYWKRRKGFFTLIAIDIRNAFKSVRWKDIIIFMICKGVPKYLLIIVEVYLSNRTLIYHEHFRIEEMPCGATLGSRIGPFLWNMMYWWLLTMEMLKNTSLIGFADDTIIVCYSDDVRLLELRVNDALA